MKPVQRPHSAVAQHPARAAYHAGNSISATVCLLLKEVREIT